MYSGSNPACSILSSRVWLELDSIVSSLLILIAAITVQSPRNHRRLPRCRFDPLSKN
ncbi:Uncharacterised protein [Vibrio cholerae]|nr:Uncharacterised protein [Vibrio cholerae]